MQVKSGVLVHIAEAPRYVKQKNAHIVASGCLKPIQKVCVTSAMRICMGKIKNACAISPAVRKEVLERDGYKCIVCGSARNLQIAHYISRGRLGLGIAKNLGTMCVRCHIEYDNGKLHHEIGNIFREHLKVHYPNWNDKELTYKKWT